jgi:DNA mismatch repair protein MutH
MERAEALEKLNTLKGVNLHDLAQKFCINIPREGKVNKGWAGHCLERFLGLPINSAQSPNFGSWELKSIPLKTLKNGSLAFKETMALTMIDPYHVRRTSFEESHLFSKLRKAVCVARLVGNTYLEPTYIHSITTFDLEGELYHAVKADYELVQNYLNDPQLGFSKLTGKMGK